MVVVLLILCAGLAFAQSGSDGRPLLQEVAKSFQNLTTYRAEGRISEDLDIGLGGGKDDYTFRVATKSPQYLRIEVAGGKEWMTGLPVLSICDGNSGWVYYDKSKSYRKAIAGDWTASYCATGTLTTFADIADDVRSAVITGTSQATYEGRSQPCTVVEAKYRVIKSVMIPPGMVGKIGRVDRKMCIDEGRKLILTDRLEADLDGGPDPPNFVVNISYDRIERNPSLSAALFEFHPPEAAKEFVPPAPPKSAPPTQPPVAGHVFSPATAIVTSEPEYSQEAWDEGIQGHVTLEVEVDEDGTILNVKVLHSLGWGLDEKAVECVRKWRFSPATENTTPRKGGAQITLTFSLPDKRPDQPSTGPITRPKRWVRLPEVELKPPSDLNEFLYVIAMDFREPALCEKIDADAGTGGTSNNRRGFQIQTLQSRCFLGVASKLHEAKLCERVVPVKTSVFDGSLMDKAYCVSRLNVPTDVAVPFPMEPFARLVQKMGYDDAQIEASLKRQHRASGAAVAPYDYWGFVLDLSLRGSVAERAEFVRRAMTLK